jgi:hypothetical protein
MCARWLPCLLRARQGVDWAASPHLLAAGCVPLQRCYAYISSRELPQMPLVNPRYQTGQYYTPTCSGLLRLPSTSLFASLCESDACYRHPYPSLPDAVGCVRDACHHPSCLGSSAAVGRERAACHRASPLVALLRLAVSVLSGTAHPVCTILLRLGVNGIPALLSVLIQGCSMPCTCEVFESCSRGWM